MRTIRFKHRPTGQVFIVDPTSGNVFGVAAGTPEITRRNVVGEASGGVRAADLLSVAREFELLWKWPAPGTRFPPKDSEGSSFPEGWFSALGGRLNSAGPEGDLEFRGFLDRVEVQKLAAGQGVAAERTALERHLSALDYRLRGELGLRDLYRAFIANRLRPLQAAKKAVGAFVMFGRGGPVDIAGIGARRPSARTGGFDAAGHVDPEILGQYRRLFDTTTTGEVDQARLTRFNAQNFQGGLISHEQWKTFFTTCSDMNQRTTVTWAQLVGLFEGSFEFVAASKADARGRRPLDRVMVG